jgi:hypothetical protein
MSSPNSADLDLRVGTICIHVQATTVGTQFGLECVPKHPIFTYGTLENCILTYNDTSLTSYGTAMPVPTPTPRAEPDPPTAAVVLTLLATPFILFAIAAWWMRFYLLLIGVVALGVVLGTRCSA